MTENQAETHSAKVSEDLLTETQQIESKANEADGSKLSSLQQDLEPVGTLEQVLVEKIAHEYWRLGVAMWYENDEIHSEGRRQFGSTETMHRLIRYQTMVNRQLFQAIQQLERLQRLRRGGMTPDPISVQVSGDVASSSGDENSEP
jgi:hypothetical protein